MELEWLDGRFSVVKWLGEKKITDFGIFSFWGKTEVETSLLCKTELVPEDVAAREDGWKGFRVIGKLDFSLVGIMARISSVLGAADISLFAISTFDTDYVFVKEEKAVLAEHALIEDGWRFKRDSA